MIKFSTVTLFNMAGEEIELYDWLITNKYADKKVESLQSLERAKQRAEFEMQNDAMQKHLNDTARYSGLYESLDFTDPNSMKIMTCDLRGPDNPLETHVCSITKQSEYTKAIVDESSVNSIIIDSNPGEPHKSWMVAASVGVTAGAKKHMIR